MRNISIEKLAAIAFFAFRVSGGRPTGAVYSYESSKYYNFSISSQSSVVGIFDYQRGNYLTGNEKGNGWSVFDYCDSNYLDFNKKLNGFSVFDYLSGSYVDVNVKSNQVDLYSYADGKYYSFGI
jgi:hypothetical protein